MGSVYIVVVVCPFVACLLDLYTPMNTHSHTSNYNTDNMAPSHVHVVSKQDVSKHASVPVDASLLPPLAEGSVRIRSHVISISVNNMGYATLGDVLGWWNTYPVPAILPAPYNDQKLWGIVPAWGYGKVVESKDASLPEGTLIWGYWPTSDLPVDFAFEPAAEKGYLWEVSAHRKVLMSVYNFYELVGEVAAPEERSWRSAAMAVWQAGYFLGQFGFAIPGSGNPPLNPAGHGDWTLEDGDLTSAVVVSLCASSKTARGLAWNLVKRGAGENAPLAFLEGTTSAAALPALNAAFETKASSYDDLSSKETIDWIAKFKPSRLVLVNCGAAEGIVRKFEDAVLASDAPLTKFSYVTLVNMPGSAEHPDPRVSVAYMNTSPVIENAHKALGIDKVVKARDAAFKEWAEENVKGTLELKVSDKVEGEDGIEGAWEKLAKGVLPRDKAHVFEFN